jgi:hypothetical protein
VLTFCINSTEFDTGNWCLLFVLWYIYRLLEFVRCAIMVVVYSVTALRKKTFMMNGFSNLVPRILYMQGTQGRPGLTANGPTATTKKEARAQGMRPHTSSGSPARAPLDPLEARTFSVDSIYGGGE